MNKTKVVTAGRGRPRGRGAKTVDRGRGRSTSTRTLRSATPKPDAPTGRRITILKIRFNPNNRSAPADSHLERAPSLHPVSKDEDEEASHELNGGHMAKSLAKVDDKGLAVLVENGSRINGQAVQEKEHKNGDGKNGEPQIGNKKRKRSEEVNAPSLEAQLLKVTRSMSRRSCTPDTVSTASSDDEGQILIPTKNGRYLKPIPTKKGRRLSPIIEEQDEELTRILQNWDEDLSAAASEPDKEVSSSAEEDDEMPSLSLQDIDYELQFNDKVYDIIEFLADNPRVSTELPDLGHAHDPDKETPYSAKTLMHMYIMAYQQQHWNICDLICDTWIRAFHRQRKFDATEPDNGLWRRNKMLERRKAKYREAKRTGNKPDEPAEFDAYAQDFQLDTQDPKLVPDVVSFDSTLLNELFRFTGNKCGARLLWADAMVLAGDKTQSMFYKTKRRGFVWDDELQFHVMSISLRMVRRKLTLKIEESTEGAWCGRYHEHGKHEPAMPCYRAVAAMQAEVDRDQGGHEGGSDVDEMEAMMRAELEKDEPSVGQDKAQPQKEDGKLGKDQSKLEDKPKPVKRARFE